MKKYKTQIIVAAVILIVVWGIWYARPVNIYTLLDVDELEYIDILAMKISEEKTNSGHTTFRIKPGEPDMETILPELESLRFHRNPVDIIQKLCGKIGLPTTGRSGRIDSNLDYDVHLFLSGKDDPDVIRQISYFGENWYYRYEDSHIRVSVKDGLERSRELGAFLYEFQKAHDSEQAK